MHHRNTHLSHLLHPPLLDETGLASATRWYVEGFAQRTGIEARLDLPEENFRLPARVELLFSASFRRVLLMYIVTLAARQLK